MVTFATNAHSFTDYFFIAFASATEIRFRFSASVFKERLQKNKLTAFSKMVFFCNNCNSQEEESLML